MPTQKRKKKKEKKARTLARTLTSTIVYLEYIKALTSGRLILQNINTGVRPIGVYEVLRQSIGKVINCILKDDVPGLLDC